jgi:ABC-type transporter Mla subunit MlaD
VVISALIVALVYLQFRGDFTPTTQLTMIVAGGVVDGSGIEGDL